MKTSLLSIGIIFLLAIRVHAQGGSTPLNGHNPVNTYSVARTTDPVTPQDGNATLGATYARSECGLNYTTASQKLSMRVPLLNQPSVPQPATFTISGIPATAVIEQAFVWTEGCGSGIPITMQFTNPFAVSAPFPMTMIGQDQDKCWGYPGTFTYRADVTSLIVGNGNYQISGLPTNPPNPQDDMDGATLIVIWSDPTQTWQGDIVIWDGCVVINGGTTTQTITGFQACTGTTSNARAFMAQGDLQGLNSSLTLNGVFPITCVEDWWNWIDVPTTVTPGQTTSSFGNSSGGDCYNFCVMGLYWQSNCQTCCPAPFTLDMDSIPSQCSASNGTATAAPQGGTGPFTYVWNTVPPQTGQTATNLPPGVYTVTVSDSLGCSHTDSVTVLGVGAITATLATTNNICFGDTNGTATITPTSGSGPYTYVWTPNVSTTNTAVNLAAGNYSVDITDNFGCTTTHTIQITEPPNVPIVASASGTSPICTGATAQLIATATGGAPPYNYFWISPVSTNDTTFVSPTTTTTYTVVISDACNTTPDSATFTVVVNPLPVISFSGDTIDGCAPVCVDFTGSAVPAIASCTWNFGDNSPFGSGPTPPEHCYYNPGQYTIELHVSDVNGCKDSLTISNYVTVFPTPVAGFNITSANPTTVLEPTVIIDDVSVGGDTCYWDFGDGNLLTVVGCGDVSNNYTDTGSFHIIQIVVNNGGCRDTIEYDVYIAPNTTLYIPNAFTPNANGTNDMFFVYGEYVNNYHLIIFDRWGNLIFESYDQTKGWDGKANGGKNIAQTDTYVYVLYYSEQLSDKKKKVIGHVNLIR